MRLTVCWSRLRLFICHRWTLSVQRLNKQLATVSSRKRYSTLQDIVLEIDLSSAQELRDALGMGYGQIVDFLRQTRPLDQQGSRSSMRRLQRLLSACLIMSASSASSAVAL
jgi:hypothetical protein